MVYWGLKMSQGMKGVPGSFRGFLLLICTIYLFIIEFLRQYIKLYEL